MDIYRFLIFFCSIFSTADLMKDGINTEINSWKKLLLNVEKMWQVFVNIKKLITCWVQNVIATKSIHHYKEKNNAYPPLPRWTHQIWITPPFLQESLRKSLSPLLYDFSKIWFSLIKNGEGLHSLGEWRSGLRFYSWDQNV